MCLTRVNDDKPKPKGFGYKVMFLTPDKKLLFIYFSPKTNLVFGKWAKSSSQSLYTEDGDHYQSGFHIFTNSKLAKKFRTTERENYPEQKVVLVRVQYEDAKVSGFQYGQEVIVAGRMKPLKIVK